jgi:hypothetical protein
MEDDALVLRGEKKVKRRPRKRGVIGWSAPMAVFSG